jgi:putative endonuclease
LNQYRKGLFAEYYAATYLFLKGYRIRKMRYKTHVGEVDIIAKKGLELTFTEVKYRPNYSKGAYAITPKSQGRIRRAAEYYMMENAKESSTIDNEIRIDAIIITNFFVIHHIKNAF